MPAIAYYCLSKTITRSRGQNAVAAAAYRTGMKLEDESNEKTQDYTRKQGIDFIFHAPPDNSPEWAHDIEKTWNAVEFIEVRSNSVVAREYIVAFPHQLNSEQRELILKDFVTEEFTRKNLISTSAIHAASNEGDERNYHAHILFHDRPIDSDGFASHKDRSVKQKKFLLHIRDRWAELSAEQLIESGYEVEAFRWREGYRTLEDQRELALVRGDLEYAEKLEGRIGTIHLGSSATALERKGIPTYRGDINREIEKGNKERQEAAKAVRREEAAKELRRLEEAERIAKEEQAKSALAKLQREIEEKPKEEQKRAEQEKLRKAQEAAAIEAKRIAELELVQKELEEKRKREHEKATRIAFLESVSMEAEALQNKEQVNLTQPVESTPAPQVSSNLTQPIESDLAPQIQSDLAQRVYLKANEFFKKMKEANYVSRAKETGEVKFGGFKRTIVLSQKGSLFSIKDTQSGEELLRVRKVGENRFIEKSLVTFDDLLLFDKALNRVKSHTKDKGKDLEL